MNMEKSEMDPMCNNVGNVAELADILKTTTKP